MSQTTATSAVETTALACAHPGCDAELHPVPAGDEFAYADATGSTFVSYRLLDKLDEVEERLAEAQRSGKPVVALLHARHMLTHQWNFGAFGHMHRPVLGLGVRFEVPEHCEWPMRLTPTGWACRQCSHRVPGDGLAILTGPTLG